MKLSWKRVAMIMLMGLVVVAPLGQTAHVALAGMSINSQEGITMTTAAMQKADQDMKKMTNHMDSMKNMQWTENEKALVAQMEMMQAVIKDLMEANKDLLQTVIQLRREGHGK